MKRLTQPMRQVLRNLADGKPEQEGLVISDMRHIVLATVLRSLRKQGYVAQRRDATHYITPRGRDALAQATVKVN